jgi:uncharacterized membrane protein
MSLSSVSENPAVTGGDGGKSTANLNYILYIVGFFTGISALVGVILAYTGRSTAAEPYRSHLNWQIRIFWRGVTMLAISTVLYMAAGILGFFTAGFGFVLMLLPLGLGIWWLVWTILAVVRGMKALGRGDPIT